MNADPRPLTVPDLPAMKAAGRRIVVLTCYDAAFARLLDQADVDVLLVGDSLNQVLAGQETTLSATLDQMIYHAASVRRGAPRALVFVDLPFLTYQVSIPEAIRNAGRVLQESGAHGVKLEGGRPMAETVRALVDRGIPGDGPSRPHAAVGARARRLPGAGPRRRRPPTGCWPTPRRWRRRGPAPSCWSCCRPSSPRGSPRRSPSPPSASAPARAATARCSCCTTCSASTSSSHPKFLKRYAELGEAVRSAVRSYAAGGARRYAIPGGRAQLR